MRHLIGMQIGLDRSQLSQGGLRRPPAARREESGALRPFAPGNGSAAPRNERLAPRSGYSVLGAAEPLHGASVSLPPNGCSVLGALKSLHGASRPLQGASAHSEEWSPRSTERRGRSPKRAGPSSERGSRSTARQLAPRSGQLHLRAAPPTPDGRASIFGTAGPLGRVGGTVSGTADPAGTVTLGGWLSYTLYDRKLRWPFGPYAWTRIARSSCNSSWKRRASRSPPC